MKKASALIAVAGLAGAATANSGAPVGDFDWTLDNAVGGSGFVDAANNSLHITGPDQSFGGTASLTTVAPTDGSVRATALYTSVDSGFFDLGQYLINGVPTTFASNSFQGTFDIEFTVAAGDSFGFAVFSEDGIFGPGNLWVSDFRFVPAPSSLALLGLGGLVATRRRR